MRTAASPPRTRLVLMLALLLLVIPQASCVTTTDLSVPTDRVACGAFQPIFWSGKDTPATVAAVKEHNAAGKAICGWGKSSAAGK